MSKKITKKLTLQKDTLQKLADGSLARVAGGGDSRAPKGCPSDSFCGHGGGVKQK